MFSPSCHYSKVFLRSCELIKKSNINYMVCLLLKWWCVELKHVCRHVCEFPFVYSFSATVMIFLYQLILLYIVQRNQLKVQLIKSKKTKQICNVLRHPSPRWWFPIVAFVWQQRCFVSIVWGGCFVTTEHSLYVTTGQQMHTVFRYVCNRRQDFNFGWTTI